MGRVGGVWRFVLRHALRSPLKSALIIVVSAFSLLAINWLQEIIIRNEAEIEYLYENTFVSVDVRQAHLGVNIVYRRLGDVIGREAVEAVLESEFVYSVYIASLTYYAYLLPEYWGGISPPWLWYGLRPDFSNALRQTGRDIVVAPDDLRTFIENNARSVVHDIPGFEVEIGGQLVSEMTVEFADGFGFADFAFAYGAPIPVILSLELMNERGYALGDYAYISHEFPSDLPSYANPWPIPNEEVVARVQIIGLHNSHIVAGDVFRDAIIMPVAALEWLKGEDIGYTTLRFTIDPRFNREMPLVQSSFRGSGFGGLSVFFNDDELRNVVQSLESNLSLLQALYPIALAATNAIGTILAVLITMQQAKKAAILRVLGVSRTRSSVILLLELFVVCVAGLAIGLGFAALTWAVLPIGIAGAYLAAMMFGATIGAIFITNRPPLDLLQVRE